MKPSLSLLLVASGFFLGFFMRPKTAEPEASALIEESKSSHLSKTGNKVARTIQSNSVTPSSVEVVSEDEAKQINLAQAVASNDIARAYQSFYDFGFSWREQFLYSHVQRIFADEMEAIETKLIRELPVQKGGEEKYYRGKGTFKVGGHSIYIDVVLQPTIDTGRDFRDNEYVQPCLRMDGYIVVDDQIIQRLDLDQRRVCNRNIFQRNGSVFVGVENYRDKTGIYVNMLLFPANPLEHLPLEYLGALSSEWKKEAQWTWAAAVEKDQELMIREMSEKAEELGVDPDSLWSGIVD